LHFIDPLNMFRRSFPIKYDEPLFRPPAEAGSLIFQITLGCSWNQCAFCEMYTSKHFSVRKEEEVLKEIEIAAALLPDTRRIFLADGNPMVLSANKLMRILLAIKKHFPKANRISTYALPGDLRSKTHEELIELKNAGLKTIYVGIESGDDEVLKRNHKSETFNSTLDGLLKAKAAGMKLSLMILNGLGGLNYSRQHAENSARLVNMIQPELLSSLVLSFPFGVKHFQARFGGDYVPMEISDLLREMQMFIAKTELNSTIFRSDHASNYLVLNGVLGRDKQIMLDNLAQAIDRPDKAGLRPEWKRGL
jgi:radical SAM superfamily enzyme YgiQ (UPF0313 family)